MTNSLDQTIGFVRASLGVDVEHVEPDGNCATFDEATHTLKLCREICPGRRSKVVDRLLRLLG